MKPTYELRKVIGRVSKRCGKNGCKKAAKYLVRYPDGKTETACLAHAQEAAA